MKIATIMECSQDKDKIKAFAAAHRQYFRDFLDNGQLRVAGPLTDNAGALWILEVETTEEVETIIKGDPYFTAGVFVKWQIIPLAYWSAKEAKGS
jgi:uncharacterized protein YciI